jgi:hypothetical protein
MNSERFASVGDMIECELNLPPGKRLRVVLSTPEACAYGNELIANGRWWKVEVTNAASRCGNEEGE